MRNNKKNKRKSPTVLALFIDPVFSLLTDPDFGGAS